MSARLILIVCMALFVGACGSSKHDPSPAAEQTGGNPVDTGKSVAKLRFYKGGYLPPPNQPNWSHDFEIDFTQSGFPVHGKTPDALCFKAGFLSQEHATEIYTLLVNIPIKYSTGPKAADAGVEYVEFTGLDGTKWKLHLLDMEVPAGEPYAVNGMNLSKVLKEVDASLSMACQ